jgi:hypothetical protein
MRRIATSLRNERPDPVADSDVMVVEDSQWGFHAIDGLPDLEAAPSYSRRQQDHLRGLLLSTGAVASGFDDDVMGELARVHCAARDLGAGQDGRQTAGGRQALTVYEIEVCDAMTARRDAAVSLQLMLADDVSLYDDSMDGVRAGLVLDMLVPAIGGTFRRSLSEVMSEFESTRHRFRLALTAVALDNGMSAVQIGQAFAFSRQLASRYLKEARQKWPELAERNPGRAQAG